MSKSHYIMGIIGCLIMGAQAAAASGSLPASVVLGVHISTVFLGPLLAFLGITTPALVSPPPPAVKP